MYVLNYISFILKTVIACVSVCTHASACMCVCCARAHLLACGRQLVGGSQFLPSTCCCCAAYSWPASGHLSPAPVSCPSPHLPGLQIMDVTLSQGPNLDRQAVELQLATISSAACLLSTRSVYCLVKYIIRRCDFPLCRLPLLFLDNVKVFGLI